MVALSSKHILYCYVCTTIVSYLDTDFYPFKMCQILPYFHFTLVGSPIPENGQYAYVLLPSFPVFSYHLHHLHSTDLQKGGHPPFSSISCYSNK